MAQSRRYARRRRRSPLRNFVTFVFVLFLAAGAVFFSIKYMGKAQNAIQNVIYPLKYTEYVDRAAREYDLEKPFVYAVIHTESHFDPDAESYAGAYGLMQLTSDTYDWISRLRDTETVGGGLLDPSINIDCGCWFLRWLFDKFGDEKLVAAAYNAGPNKVEEWLSDPDCSIDGETLSVIPYEETEKYVEKVIKAKKMYKKLYFS